MKKPMLALIWVVVMLVLVVVWLGWRRFERPRSSADVAASSAIASETRSAENIRATAAAKGGGHTRRTLVPRLVLASAPPTDAAPIRHPRQLSAGGGPPRDRRGSPGPNARIQAEQVQQHLEQAREAAQKCLEQWATADPALEAGVMLGIELDERGLDKVWVEGHADVPSGPLACLTNSIYPIDWGGIVTEPAMITMPIRYQDAGAGR